MLYDGVVGAARASWIESGESRNFLHHYSRTEGRFLRDHRKPSAVEGQSPRRHSGSFRQSYGRGEERMPGIQTLQHQHHPRGTTGSLGSVRINHAAVNELASARPTATHNTTRKPATKASSIACRPARSEISAAASRGRCALISLRTAGGSARRSNCRSSVRLNTLLRINPITATASKPATRDTALLTPDATPA